MKIKSQLSINFGTEKVVLRKKFIGSSANIKKSERSQISNLMMPLKD
jgi:hypothetical protein